MTPHDWIALASIVVVAVGGVLGALLKRAIDRLDEDTRGLRGDVRGLDDRVRKLEIDLVAQSGKVAAAQTLATDVRDDLHRMESKLDRLLGLTTPPHGLTRTHG